MKNWLLASFTLLSLMANAISAEENLHTLAEQYQVSHAVLSDYVNSYNFKCPDEVNTAQLTSMLSHLNEDTELSVMLESDKMQWRDLYVEARALIDCFSEGEVSRSD
ncbi:MAG: hypothetical protein V7785_23410 [Bermanella sp.]